MFKIISIAVCFAASILISASIVQAVTIEVGYAYSSLFDVTFKRIYPMFRKAHPDIEVNSGQLMKIMKMEPTPFFVNLWRVSSLM